MTSPPGRSHIRRILRRTVLALAGLLIPCTALGIWANAAILNGSQGFVFLRAEETPGREVAIVFGARAWTTGPSNILQDRLDAGIALYEKSRVHKLLLSGDHGRADYDEANTMRRYAIAQGVPPEDIFLDHAGFSTYDTLVRARRIFGVRTAVLVTNTFHQSRAIYTARACGIDAVGLASDARVYEMRIYNSCREALARTLAWLDVNVIHPDPRLLGPAIDIRGDGRVTWDAPSE